MDRIEITDMFVDDVFERDVLSLIPGGKVETAGRNRVLRYGSKVPYRDRIISPQIPDVFLPFKDRLNFDSVTINEYYPGQAIDWHIDHLKAGPEICIVSLLSDADLFFRRHKNDKPISFHIPRYSLTIFSGDLRTNWQHYLKANEHRVSVVFRNSKHVYS